VVSTDLYLVVNFGTERSDKVGGAVVKGRGTGNVSKEVLIYKFFLRAPDLPSFFVEDGVLVWVDLSLVSTRWHSKEMREESKVDVIDIIEGGRRLYGGGGDGQWVAERWGWAPNDVFRQWEVSWENGRDGWQDVLDFLDEGEVINKCVKIRSVGGDVGEEVQRFMLKFVELAVSNNKEGVEDEACRWGSNIVVEEWGSWGENILARLEHMLNGLGGSVNIGLVF